MIKNNKRFNALIAVFLITSFMTTLLLSGIDVKASVLGPKYYYFYLEKQNLNDIKKKCMDYYKDKNLIESSYDSKASAKLDGDLMNNDEEMKQIAEYLSKLEFNVKYNQNNKDINDNYSTLYIGTKYDNKDFVDMDIKSADKKAVIKFPSLTEKSLGIDSTDIYKSSAILINAYTGDDKAFKELFGESRDAYKDLLAEYLKDTIIDQIPDSKIELNKDADFENIKCNAISFNIDKEVVANIYRSLADKLEKDQNIRTICNSAISSFLDFSELNDFGEDIEKPTPEEIDEEIKSICESLNEQSYDLEDINFTYTAYYKNNGDIISRQIEDKISNSSVGFSTYKDSSGKDILNFFVKEKEDKIFELKNEKKLLKGNYDGECIINISDKNLLKANYTYEKNAKIGGLDAFVGNIQGKINPNQLKDYWDDSAINDNSNNIYFNINNKRKDNNTMQGKSAVTFKLDGKRVGLTLFTEVQQSNKCNITKPNISLDNAIMMDDEDGLEELINDISEGLQEKVMAVLLYNDYVN